MSEMSRMSDLRVVGMQHVWFLRTSFAVGGDPSHSTVPLTKQVVGQADAAHPNGLPARLRVCSPRAFAGTSGQPDPQRNAGRP
jgi:hypothetical protein